MDVWGQMAHTSIFTKWIQILLTIGYGFGLMQITQVSKIALLIPLISSVLDAEDEENSEGMCNIDHEAASPYTTHTAVLPKPSLIDANIYSAIMAMLDIVQPKNDDVD